MGFRLSIPAGELAGALRACSQVIDGGSKIPILKCIRISVTDDIATVIATDTIETVTARVLCSGEGAICVDANSILVKVSSLRAEADVMIEEKEREIVISQGRSRWRLPFMLDDFPMQVADEVDGDAIEIGDDFMAALNAARGAVATNASNNYQGIWLDGGVVIGVDGRQFRVIDTGLKTPSCVLPPEVERKVSSMFKDGARLTIGGNHAQFRNGDLIYKIRLMDFTTSPWRPAIDQWRVGSSNACTVDSGELAASAKRAAAIAASGEKAGAFINMQLRFKAGEIEIFAKNSLGEEGIDSIACDAEIEQSVGVNGKMLIDSLATTSGMVRISYGEERDPILIEPAAAERLNVRVVFPRVFM